jgi:uncharacterized protein (TIGR02145 family)
MNKIIFILLVIAYTNAYTQSQFEISGNITYDNTANSAIEYSKVILKDSLNQIYSFTYTDTLGNYSFSSISNGKFTIEIIPIYKWGGVNPTDALFTLRYFVKLSTFKDALKKKAADVNIDNKINTVDALLINRRFVKLIKSFPAGEWLWDNNTVVVNGQNIIVNIKIICTGDVDGSFIPAYKFVNCGDNLPDSRDGKSYKTVLIGNQCWMKENLNIGTRIDGVNDQADNSTIEKYCYNNDESNCNVYGGLYQWDEVMQYVTTEKAHGICQSGWHIPSDAEWTTLATFLGGESVAGGKMKEAGYSHWASPNGGATNITGFTGLPGGCKSMFEGSFLSLGYYGYFWTSTEYNEGSDALYRILSTNYENLSWSYYYKTYGVSVRCVKDCPAINAPGSGINTPSQEHIIWNWQAVTGALGYKWSIINEYSTATDNGISTSYTQTGLTCDSNYTLYAWTYNSCGNSSVSTLTQKTTACPCSSVYPPHNGTNTSSQDQIIWRWLTVTGASGYKWNTINDYSTAIDNGISTSITQSGLSCNTSYSIYVWAYNSCGDHSNPSFLYQTTLECTSTFICGDNLVDSRDSKSYKTIQIGTQCWMKENLNIGTRIIGATNQSDNATIEKYCYNDDEANCSVYGGLYQWNEAMQYVTTEPAKGICPTGWHIPTEGDWSGLTTYLGGVAVAGGKMKETGLTHWATPNTSATNSVGFTSLGAGFKYYTNGTYYYMTNRTYYWSSGQYNASDAYTRTTFYNQTAAGFGSFFKTSGSSVRCIED